MSTGESHKFHLFKRPSKSGSTFPGQKCNRDATPEQNCAPYHVRLSLSAASGLPAPETKVPLRMGSNLSGNEGGQPFSARVHRVNNQGEETHDSSERKQSASCRMSLLRGSMPSGAVRCRKTSERNDDGINHASRARTKLLFKPEAPNKVSAPDTGDLSVAGRERTTEASQRIDARYQ
jgi:hypothetical protein